MEVALFPLQAEAPSNTIPLLLGVDESSMSSKVTLKIRASLTNKLYVCLNQRLVAVIFLSPPLLSARLSPISRTFSKFFGSEKLN